MSLFIYFDVPVYFFIIFFNLVAFHSFLCTSAFAKFLFLLFLSCLLCTLSIYQFPFYVSIYLVCCPYFQGFFSFNAFIFRIYFPCLLLSSFLSLCLSFFPPLPCTFLIFKIVFLFFYSLICPIFCCFLSFLCVLPRCPVLLVHPEALEGLLSTLLSLERRWYPSRFARTSPLLQSSLFVLSSISLISSGWVSVSLRTSVCCSNPLLSTSVPLSRPLSLWPPLYPSISATMLPTSILVLRGHPLVLRQALYLSSSEETVPQACALPQSPLTFLSTMSDTSVWESSRGVCLR